MTDAVGNARAHAGRHRRTCTTPRSRAPCATRSWTASRCCKGQAMGLVDGRLVVAPRRHPSRVRRRAAGLRRRRRRGRHRAHRAQRFGRHAWSSSRPSRRAVLPGCRGPLPRGRPAAVPDPCERRMTDLLTLENTAIVLDSTCDPPDGFFDRPGLYMVPLKVHFGDEMFRDGVDMTYREFFAKLEALRGAAHHVAAHGGRVHGRLRGGARALRARVLAAHLRRDERHGARRRAGGRGLRARRGVRHAHRHHARCRCCAERLRARLERRLHARRGARLHRALPRATRTCSSTPRRSTTCGAAAASVAPRRSSAASSTSSRSSMIADGTLVGLRQGARPEEGAAGHGALHRGAQRARRRDLLRHHRRRERRGAAAHPRAHRAAAAQRALRLPGARRRRRRHAHRPGHVRLCYDRGVTEPHSRSASAAAGTTSGRLSHDSPSTRELSPRRWPSSTR